MNPLLRDSSLPFEAIDFDQIKAEHFLPALEESIKEASSNIDKIKNLKESSFKSVIVALETSSDRLDQITEIFYSLFSAQCSDELAAVAEDFNKKLTNFSSDITLDAELFEKVELVYGSKDSLDLNDEEKMLLENSYKDFVRNGAKLVEKDKGILREIDQNISLLNLKFSENIRHSVNSYLLEIDNEEDLKGLPDSVIEAAIETAKSKSSKARWAFTLDFPSFYPFMQYCENRDLRKKFWEASAQKAVGGEFDNRGTVLETIKLRSQRAKLLGYKDHPEFVLEKRMAKNSKTVLNFIDDIIGKAMPRAKEDFEKLKALKLELTGDDDFRKYDAAFYTEILKKRELDFDDEEIRPYFKLENVINGVFEVATKLYDIKFKKLEDLSVYHKDVDAFEVTDLSGKHLGLFYTDFYPRAEKKQGAWMTNYRNQGLQFGEVKRPFVSIVCNFTKPTESRPSLLTLNEVLTLFHEFGHALHGLLANSQFKSLSGPNVLWDFVELPSQIMENWVLEKECLDLFAKHFESNESIPESLIAKIKKSQTFLEGLGTMRQMSFSALDMKWHLANPASVSSVENFEKEVLSEYSLYPEESLGCMSCSFGHIFAGGYSSGYYSYKWAEVLDADAFSVFKEKGIFDKKTATSFKENILMKGGSVDPMVLYKKFRGAAPSVEPLLKRAGLI